MLDKPYFALASGSIFLAGCCSASLHTPLAESAHPAPLGLASVTQASLDTDFAHERAHLPEGNKQPTLGLALSGGGTKAAMYAHGVMHGLNAMGLLDHVDVISTTSGGGYAAYWYFSKRMEAARTRAFDYKQIFEDCIPYWYTESDKEPKLFKDLMGKMIEKGNDEKRSKCSSEAQWSQGDPYRWQAHLVRWPDVFDTNIAKINGDPQPSPILNYLGLGIAAILEIPLTLIGFDSAVPREYQYGIERAWGLNPLARDESTSTWSYSNDTDEDFYSFGKRVDPVRNQWQELRAMYDSKTNQNLPLWVLNTTLGQKGSLPDMNNLYEITPFGHGSPRYGYHHETPPLATISEGVRASAGFADHQGIDSSTGRDVVKYVGKVIGAFEWGVYMPIASNGNKRMRLSDGGGADNLGLMSLIRRGLDDIIVVDSAQDVEGFLADLCWARNALEQEGLTMEFPGLVDFDKQCDDFRDFGKASFAYNLSAWANPVVPGTVSWPSNAKEPSRKINLWLLKPAWDEHHFQAGFNTPESCGPGVSGCWLSLFWGHNNNAASLGDGDYLLFPQHATAKSTANSSTYLFWAYRELGRMQASNLTRDPTTGRVSTLNEQIVPQERLPAVCYKRPVHRSAATIPSGKLSKY